MRKYLSLNLIVVLVALIFAGCGGTETVENGGNDMTTSSTEVISSEETLAEEISSDESSKNDSSSKKPSNSKKPSSKPSKNDGKNNSSSKRPTGVSSKPTSSKKPSKTSSEDDYYEITYTDEEKIYYGLDPDLYKLGLESKGNSSRIAALMQKAKKGGNYKIAVLGGSISRGAGTSNKFFSYGNLVCEWWKDNFPNANFEFINAGFGATNPEMACYRMQEDLLNYKPDFVVVDYTVNTYLDNNVASTIPTILYKILSQKNSPAVMYIHFTNCVRDKYEGIGICQKPSGGIPYGIEKALKEYDIPTMSYHNYIWDKLDSGKLKWENIGADYIHPNDNGHMIAANLITAHLKEVLNNLSKYSGKITAPQKLKDTSYLNLGYILNNSNGVTMSGSFEKRSGQYADGKGWGYTASSKASALTIPVPENKSIKVFMSITSGSTGDITVTDSNNKTYTIRSNAASTPTLVDIGKMSGKITFTPNFTNGGFVIYGIGVNK